MALCFRRNLATLTTTENGGDLFDCVLDWILFGFCSCEVNPSTRKLTAYLEKCRTNYSDTSARGVKKGLKKKKAEQTEWIKEQDVATITYQYIRNYLTFS